MTARIIDGKAIGADLRARVAGEVRRLRTEHGIEPGLAVVLVGENPASAVYVRSKSKQTLQAGMRSFDHRLPETGRRSSGIHNRRIRAVRRALCGGRSAEEAGTNGRCGRRSS